VCLSPLERAQRVRAREVAGMLFSARLGFGAMRTVRTRAGRVASRRSDGRPRAPAAARPERFFGLDCFAAAGSDLARPGNAGRKKNYCASIAASTIMPPSACTKTVAPASNPALAAASAFTSTAVERLLILECDNLAERLSAKARIKTVKRLARPHEPTGHPQRVWFKPY